MDSSHVLYTPKEETAMEAAAAEFKRTMDTGIWEKDWAACRLEEFAIRETIKLSVRLNGSQVEYVLEARVIYTPYLMDTKVQYVYFDTEAGPYYRIAKLKDHAKKEFMALEPNG